MNLDTHHKKKSHILKQRQTVQKINSVIWETCPLQTWKVYSFLFHADQTTMSEAAVVEFFNDLTHWLLVGLEHLNMAVFDSW